MQRQSVERLTPDQFAEWIAIDIEARRKGGLNLQDEYLKLVEQLPKEVRRQYRARTIELWTKVENDLAKPKPTTVWINGRPYPADLVERHRREHEAKKAEVSFFGPQPQPKADPKPEDKPEEVPEPEEVDQEQPPQALVPLGFAPLGNDEVLELDPAAPFDNAQKIVSLRAWHPEEGMRTWHYWQQSFWQWVGLCWREVEDDTVRSSIWHQLNVAEKIGRRGRRERFEPTPKDVNATIDALKAATNLPTKGNPMPGWLGSEIDEDVRELVACQNGILHMRTRKLREHTPRFWSPNVLDFAYNPRARAPRFKQFLEEVWPGEPQTQQCLLELFGLCLRDITKYQKAFMFVGPKRGGRGTIGRVLRGLIGPDNYIGTSLKAFSEQFGMENFIGKK